MNKIPRIILKLEGVAVFIVEVVGYFLIQGNWLLFIVCFFLPDISMIGYLKNKKIGSIIYNSVHNYVLAIILLGIGFLFNQKILIELGFILTAHVALDRFLGYGLKYPDDFKSTHMQKV